jgi:hypothetical protein
MTHPILSFAYLDLDFAAQRAAVSETLQVVGSFSVPRRSILLRYGEHVLVTDRRSIGILGEPGDVWSPLDLALQDYLRSALGDLVLTDVEGGAYLWRPPAPPRAVWRAQTPDAISAASLGDHRLLVMRFADRGMAEAFAIDADDNRILWRLDPGFHYVAATPLGLLTLTSSMDALECFDSSTGARRWNTPWGGGTGLFGVVDGILWGAGKFQILGIDCATGHELPPIAVENAHLPSGVLDERGVFHCCHGLNYQTYDLRDGGRRLSYAELRITAAGPTLGAGPGGMIPTTDGRLIFSDQRHGVWVVHPERPTEPELIWRAHRMITGLVARAGQVLVAEDSGTVTALGAP